MPRVRKEDVQERIQVVGAQESPAICLYALWQDYNREEKEVTAVMMLSSLFPIYKSKMWWLCLAIAVSLCMMFMSAMVYAAGFGGYVSEFLMGRSGVVDSNLLIGRDGVSNSGLDLGMSGIVAVTEATNVYMDGSGTHATLNGNLQSLNGFPQAIVYFQWGYDTSYGHTTTGQTVAAIGAFTADIAHFDPSQTVYYRAVVDCDGRNYSSASTFVASGGIVSGFNLLNAVVVLAYVALVIFVVLAIGSKSTIVALIVLAVAIYLGEAFVVALQEAIRNLY